MEPAAARAWFGFTTALLRPHRPPACPASAARGAALAGRPCRPSPSPGPGPGRVGFGVYSRLCAGRGGAHARTNRRCRRMAAAVVEFPGVGSARGPGAPKRVAGVSVCARAYGEVPVSRCACGTGMRAGEGGDLAACPESGEGEMVPLAAELPSQVAALNAQWAPPARGPTARGRQGSVARVPLILAEAPRAENQALGRRGRHRD